MKRSFSVLAQTLTPKSTYKLTVSFDGDGFEGSAFMKGSRTLEGELITAMHKANLLKNSKHHLFSCYR